MAKEAKKQLVTEGQLRAATGSREESRDETSVNAKSPGVLIASKEQFEKAQRKTSKLHAGLFRRLAK